MGVQLVYDGTAEPDADASQPQLTAIARNQAAKLRAAGA